MTFPLTCRFTPSIVTFLWFSGKYRLLSSPLLSYQPILPRFNNCLFERGGHYGLLSHFCNTSLETWVLWKKIFLSFWLSLQFPEIGSWKYRKHLEGPIAWLGTVGEMDVRHPDFAGGCPYWTHHNGLSSITTSPFWPNGCSIPIRRLAMMSPMLLLCISPIGKTAWKHTDAGQ